jgi:hypothetical protein
MRTAVGHGLTGAAGAGAGAGRQSWCGQRGPPAGRFLPPSRCGGLRAFTAAASVAAGRGTAQGKGSRRRAEGGGVPRAGRPGDKRPTPKSLPLFSKLSKRVFVLQLHIPPLVWSFFIRMSSMAHGACPSNAKQYKSFALRPCL